MKCPKCLDNLMMKDSAICGGVYYHQGCQPPNPPDPTVECAKELLRGALNALEEGEKYNNPDFAYKDYMIGGAQTVADRCLEPMFRTKATRDFHQAKDHCGYVALGLAHFLGGTPPSKISLPEIPKNEPTSR